MLTQLHIQGLAIIDSLSIQFSSGFNVITGETGAGKSILIKALSLLLGAKANSETVRHGRESATVSGLFETYSDHPSVAVLKKYAIPVDIAPDSIQILVRRTINNSGRSLAWINDFPVTVAVLKEFGAALIDIFGQHENQRLLNPTTHTFYLDQFLKDKRSLEAYREAYLNTQETIKTLSNLIDQYFNTTRDHDYILYRYQALNDFNPEIHDYEEITALCKMSREKMSVVKTLELSQDIFEQGAGGNPLSSKVWDIARTLDKIQTLAPETQSIADEAKVIANRLDDLSYELGKILAKLDFDETKLEASQERLARYQEFFRKLSVSGILELITEKERLKSELEFAESASNSIDEMLRRLAVDVEKLRLAAFSLTQSRSVAKRIVCERAERELRELAMPGAKLEVEFTSAQRDLPNLNMRPFGSENETLWHAIATKLIDLGEFGAEKAQFFLSTNEGEPLHPLHKTASGGEVSRIMLALKKALADGADTCILVFDEIDTGISGRVADIVGRKMRELSKTIQVICISHLPQVAAYADSHFLVHKIGSKKRTESTIDRLSLTRSEEEIARLLSGQEVTTSSLANARALIKKAKSFEPVVPKSIKAAKTSSPSQNSRKQRDFVREV